MKSLEGDVRSYVQLRALRWWNCTSGKLLLTSDATTDIVATVIDATSHVATTTTAVAATRTATASTEITDTSH